MLSGCNLCAVVKDWKARCMAELDSSVFALARRALISWSTSVFEESVDFSELGWVAGQKIRRKKQRRKAGMRFRWAGFIGSAWLIDDTTKRRKCDVVVGPRFAK